MTTVLINGFDFTNAETQIATLGGTSGVTGRSGRGLACRRSSNSGTLAILPSNLSTGWMGVGMRFSTLVAARALEFTAPDNATIHFRIGIDASGHVVIYGPANTIVATSASVVVVGTIWNYYEVNWIISDTVGLVEVRQDETVVVSFSGDTRNGTATQVGFIGTTVPAGINIDFDDLWVSDSAYLGDKTVEALSPNGNGSSSGWLGSDGNSVDNYLLVDEATTLDVTDYVAASVSGTLDLYTMTDLPTGYSVDMIQEAIFVQKSDAGTPPTVLPVAKGQAGATRTDTALSALSTTASVQLGQLRTTDPDGNALTAARVNAMEVGVKIS